MASVNATIRVDIDASAANAGLASMAAQMSRFNKGMIAGANSMQAAQIAAAKKTAGHLNATGNWLASTGAAYSRVSAMQKQFDKGTFASMQQWKDTSARATKALGANAVMNQMAAQRVRALQTQYVSLGKEVNGVSQAMKIQPTGMIGQWTRDTNRFGREATFAHQKAVLFHRRMQMGANSMINWGKNTQWAGRQMMVGLGIPLGIAAVGAVRSFKEIEQASISFKRVYGDSAKDAAKAGGVLEQVMSGVGQEYTKYGVAMSDTIGVAARAAATGQKGEALIATTRETLRLATLGQLDYDQALEATIATQTAFGVSSKGLTRVTDFLNAAENQTILSMDDMTKAIPRVAPVIKGLGGDVEDLGVLMTALRAGGVTAEQGANALKSGLASLINPTSSATEAMKEFGIPLEKIVNTNKGDLIGTVQDFGKALAKLPKFEQQQALEALFGKYQYARMGALFRNINDKQAQMTAKLSKSSNAKLASYSASEMQQISDSALNKFQGAIERLKTAAAPLGEAILSGLAPLMDGVTWVLDKITGTTGGKITAIFAGVGIALATVGTMLTGVFAQFFGYMAKGAALARNVSRWVMRKPSLRYQSLDELEATAAQRQLGAAAEQATASLYAEKGAVTQLAQALNMMNAELRESVGLQAAAAGSGRRPGGTVGGTPVVPKPKTPPSSGGAAVAPKPTVPTPRVAPMLPLSQFRRTIASGSDRAHVARPINLLAKENDALLRQIKGTYGPETGVGQVIARAERTGTALNGLNARFLAMDKTLNAEMDKTGGRGVLGRELAADAMVKKGGIFKPFFYHLAKGAGVSPNALMNDPAVRAAAQNFHKDYVQAFAGAGGQRFKGADYQKIVEPMMQRHFGNLPGWDKTGLVHQIRGEGGIKETARLDPSITGWKSSASSLTKLESMFDTSKMDFSASEALVGSASALNGAASALKGAASSLAGAGKAGAGKPGVGGAKGYVGPDGKIYPSAKPSGLPKITPGPSSRLDSFSPVAARWYDPNASQRAQQAHQRLVNMGTPRVGGAGRGASDYNGFMSQKNQSALAGNLLGSKRGMVKGAIGSLWNSARSGGVFGGGTRGMSPEEKLAFQEKRQGKVSGKLFAFGMAADAVTMGLSLAGKEIPPLAHGIGMSAMALGMFPGAITPVISLLSNPVTGALAAVAAVAGAGVVAWKFLNNKAAEAGEAAGEYAVAGTKTTAAMEEAYQTESLATKVRLRREAKLANASTEQIQQAQDIAQSEIGKNISQQYADAVGRGGIQAAQEGMTNTLANAVLQDIMSAGQARALASQTLGDVGGSQVSSQLNSLIGKKGQFIEKDPTGFALDSLNRNAELAEKAMGTARNLQSMPWDDFQSGFSEVDKGLDWNWGTAFDTDAEFGDRAKDAIGGFLANATPLGWTGLTEGIGAGISNANDISNQVAENNAYASTLWTNTLASGYQNRVAAEERLRLAEIARSKAQQEMTRLEKSDPQGFKQNEQWQNAAKAVEKYNGVIQKGKDGLLAFDEGYQKMALQAQQSFANLDDGQQAQQLETMRTALNAMYSNDPAKLAAMALEQGVAQEAATRLGAGDIGKTNEIMASYQRALLTGMDPGSVGALQSILPQGEDAFAALDTFMGKTSGGVLNEIIAGVQTLKGSQNVVGQALMEANTAQDFQTLSDKVQAFSKLPKQVQQDMGQVFGRASLADIKNWIKAIDNAKDKGKDIPNNLGTGKGGRTPGTGDRGGDGGGDGGGDRGGDRDRDNRTPPRTTPRTPGRTPGTPGASTNRDREVKPNIAANTRAGNAEGKARGASMSNAMQNAVLSKVNGMNQKVAAASQTAGTKQGKVQGNALGSAIGQSLKKSSGQALSQKGKTVTIKTKYAKPSNPDALKPKSKAVEIKTKYKKPENQSALKAKGKPVEIKTKYAKPTGQGQLKPKPQTVKVNVNVSGGAQEKLQSIRGVAQSLQGLNPTINISAVDNASGVAQAAGQAVEAVGNLTPKAVISADPTPAIIGALQATAAIAAIPSSKTVTINVVRTGEVATGGYAGHLGFAAGGGLNRKAFSGKKVSGPGGPEDDKVPAWLSPGEFVMREKAVKKYGVGFMYDVNAMRLNKGGDGKSKDPGKDKDKEKDSKKKGGSDDSGDKEKDKGWKELNKNIKKLANAWGKYAKNVGKDSYLPGLGKTGKGKKKRLVEASPEMMSALLGTDSPNAIKNFFNKNKKARALQKKLKQQIKFEQEKEFWDQTAEENKALKADAYRTKLLKARSGYAKRFGKYNDVVQNLTDADIMHIKKMNLKGGQLRKFMDKKRKFQELEYKQYEREEARQEDFNNKIMKSKSLGYAAAQWSDEDVKRYQSMSRATGDDAKSKERFAQKVNAKIARRRGFDLARETNFGNRFDGANSFGLTPEALVNLTQEDYEILQGLSGDELSKFATSLNDAAAANIKAAQAAKLFEKRLEYMTMSETERIQEMISLYGQQSDAINSLYSAKGEEEIQNTQIMGGEALTRSQIESRIAQKENIMAQHQFDQTKANQEIEAINKSYEDQEELLDKIGATQQIISNLQKGRLSVASALSSGDIAAAAAAAQEQRSAESQANLDMMRQSLEDEKESKIKKHQDAIDSAQKQIDAISNEITGYQLKMDEIAAKWAVEGANAAAPYDKIKTSLEASTPLWEKINKELETYIGLLNEVDPSILNPAAPQSNNDNNKEEDDEAPPNSDVDPERPNKTKRGKKVQNRLGRLQTKAGKAIGYALDKTEKTKSKKDDKKFKAFREADRKLLQIADNANNAAEKGQDARAERLADKYQNSLNEIHKDAKKKNLITSKQVVKKVKENDKKTQSKKKKEDDNKAQAQSKNKKNKGGWIKRYESGGFVSGFGNTDKVPALLTPGEFVMTKGAAARYGKALEKVNSPSFKFADKAGMASRSYDSSGNVYNLTVNAGSNASADEIATITLRKIKELDSMRIREMRTF